MLVEFGRNSFLAVCERKVSNLSHPETSGIGNQRTENKAPRYVDHWEVLRSRSLLQSPARAPIKRCYGAPCWLERGRAEAGKSQCCMTALWGRARLMPGILPHLCHLPLPGRGCQQKCRWTLFGVLFSPFTGVLTMK